MLEVRVSEAHAELIVDGELQISAESVAALTTLADRMGDASPLGIVPGTEVAIDLASPAAAGVLASFHPSPQGGYAEAISERWASQTDSSSVSAELPLGDQISVNGHPWGWHLTLPEGQAGPTFHLVPVLPPELLVSINLWMAESMVGAYITIKFFQFGDGAAFACVDDDSEDRRWSEVVYWTRTDWLQHASETALQVLGWGPICPSADDSDFEWPPLETSPEEALSAYFSSCAFGAGWQITIEASPLIAPSTLSELLLLLYRPCKEHSELYTSRGAVLSAADQVWVWSASAWVPLDGA